MPNRPRKREAASIHVKAGDNSTISYMMPMVATNRGYEPSLNVHLDTVTVTSSLNDIRLITADSCVVSLDFCTVRRVSLIQTNRSDVSSLLRCDGILRGSGPLRSRSEDQSYFSFVTILICSPTLERIGLRVRLRTIIDLCRCDTS